MTELSRQPGAYIRPSAAGARLGGLAAHTHESIELCELAGYDWIILETVGTGQSEVDVALSADLVLLVLTADGGDELQALKRGVNEVMHALVVNKADGERQQAASALAEQYVRAHALGSEQELPAFVTSAADGSGVQALIQWLAVMQARWLDATEQGVQSRAARRKTQRLAQFDRALQSELLPRLLERGVVAQRYQALKGELAARELSVSSALERFLAALA
jgi:LAO/AO transport system kinase